MIIIISVAFVLSYILVVWFKSDAFAEYMTAFGLAGLFHIAEYNELHKHGYGGNYSDFLYEYYRDNFFIRLGSCPICLSFWLGLFEAFSLNDPQAVVSIPLILFFYLLFNKMF